MEGFEEDECNDEQSSRINLKTENTNNYIEDPGRQDFNFSDSPDNNPFCIDSYDDNKQGTTRMSGNEKSLLHTMTHGDIRQEILDEVRRGVIDVQDSKECNQNTTQGIIDNLEDIDCRDDENTFEYKKSSTMDECNATREKAHRDDSGTTDNYFFGFTDSMQIQNRDMWDGEFLSRETVHNVKISSGICVPFKDNNSYKNKEKMVYIQDNSPKDSDISADSFDSVKRINKEIDNDQTNNLSARFFEKVNQVRSNRAQQESLKKNMKNNKTGMFNNSSISSLLVSNTMNLPTILEQEENMKKHKRSNSSSNAKQLRNIEDNQLEINQIMNEYKQKEMQILTNFQDKISQLKELLKKEIAIKFVLLEKYKNIKGENEKLRELIGKKNFLDYKAQLKDVGCQVSIGSSCLANEINNKGSIGKYYKDMFPHHNQKLQSKDEADQTKPELKMSASIQDLNSDEFFNQEATPELVPKFESQEQLPKKKVITKPGSCPRQRRRSRQDRGESSTKKQNVLNELGPGTTIISIEDFSGLEEEIIKIATNKGQNAGRTQYKSENRQNKKKVANSQSFRGYQPPQKGKPPLRTSDNTDEELAAAIQKPIDRRPSYKQKYEQKKNKILSKNIHQKSSRVNSIDCDPQSTPEIQKKLNKVESKVTGKQLVSNFDDLIQQKKEALGIKPLNSTLNNYKVVYNENEKLQKIIKEQKRTIKLMRQEKVEQMKELSKHIEKNKNCIEIIIKYNTQKHSRQIK